jgi:hypothetical protein
MADNFPYKKYMDHPAWTVMEQAVVDLVENEDLELLTPARYVIGSLLKPLSESKLLPPTAPQLSTEQIAKIQKTVGYVLSMNTPFNASKSARISSHKRNGVRKARAKSLAR